MSKGPERSLSYGEYLSLNELLSLQNDDVVSADEMHFIVVHQTFELWFKQVIRELAESRDALDTKSVSYTHLTLPTTPYV